LRIKIERIKEDSVRVVEIEGHDLSACKGIHVENLSEIGDFAVVSFKGGRRKEVKFIVGEAAREHHRSSKRK
jgi:alanyl-tRNA synthetase